MTAESSQNPIAVFRRHLKLARLRHGLLAASVAACGSPLFAQYPVNQYPAFNQESAAAYSNGISYSRVSPQPPTDFPAVPGAQLAPMPLAPARFAPAPFAPAPFAPAPFASAPAAAPPATQYANQSDQQLLAVARLFEQQGRYPQAQRIYGEIERRRGATAWKAPAANYPVANYPVAAAVPYQGTPVYVTSPQSIGPQNFGPQNYAAAGLQNSGVVPTWTPAPIQTMQQFQPMPSMEMTTGPSTPTNGPPYFPPNTQAGTPATALPMILQPDRAEAYKAGGGQMIADVPSANSAGSLPAMSPQGSVQATSPGPMEQGLPADVPPGQTNWEIAVDRNLTAPVKTVSSEQEAGWRTAVTPLPAALHPSDSGTVASSVAVSNPVPVEPSPSACAPEQQRPRAVVSDDSRGEPQTAPAVAQPASRQQNELASVDTPREAPSGSAPKLLPESPASSAPLLELSGAKNGDVRTNVPATSEPSSFVSPKIAPQIRRMPVVLRSETAEPRELPPLVASEHNPDRFEATHDAADRLSRQTDAIKIIPGQRVPGRNTPEAQDENDEAADQPQVAANNDESASVWKTHASIGNSAAGSAASSDQDSVHRAKPKADNSFDREPDRPRRRSPNVDPSVDTFDRISMAQRRMAYSAERHALERRPAFDLAAQLSMAEFREIHTRPVLEGLELLAQREARHRVMGAQRLGLAGPDARTALPALRKVLLAEPDKAVRLRIAEAILKLQPGDHVATECLVTLLSDRSDWELRQYAAGALAVAASARNPVAIVRLTDALDDSHPSVRATAAIALAQFGPAAIDCAPRLEIAASNDVPEVRAAASAALASIKGEKARRALPRVAAQNASAATNEQLVAVAAPESSAGPPLLAQPAPLPVSGAASTGIATSGHAILSDQPAANAGDSELFIFEAEHTAAKPLTSEPVRNQQASAVQNSAVSPPVAANDALTPQLLPADPAGRSVIRPLRMEPAKHPHIPGKRSQTVTPPATLNLESEAGSAKASPQP